MTTTTEQIRAWRGPALLTYGFRPFFLGAALWAALAMVLWVAMLAFGAALPSRFDPVGWHAHAFLFGYLPAVVAGFLLTAVPNWTGRLPIVGWPLGALFALWVAGRAAVTFSAVLPVLAVAVIDLAMPVTLAAVIAREIVAGRNWRNLIVLAMLAALTAGNALFHWEAAQGGLPAQGYGLRLGLAAAMMMIAVIGGRVVPSFTRNWLVRRGPGRLPVPPMQALDRVALAALLAALVAFLLAPQALPTTILLGLAGIAHLVRLLRWAGERTGAEPLVWVLHAGYAFLPAGALALAAARLWPEALAGAAAQHLWMAGAVGLMTLAVMTRATLGHTGQALTAGPATVVVYLALVTAVAARLAAGFWPWHAGWLHVLSGAAWMLAYGGFALLYGPLLLRARAAKAARAGLWRHR